jgi:hypothetical protein
MEIALRDGIIETVVTGTIRFNDSLRILQRVISLARESQTTLLLFDSRTAIHPEFHTLTLRMATVLSFLIPSRYTFAIVDLPNSAMASFVENVGRNRGFHVRTFSTLEDARHWLRAS